MVNTKTMIAGLVSIAIGAVLLPVVISFKTTAQTAINDSTSAEHVIIGMLPMFWSLSLLGVGAGLIYKSFA